jgi:hypothetical protein
VINLPLSIWKVAIPQNSSEVRRLVTFKFVFMPAFLTCLQLICNIVLCWFCFFLVLLYVPTSRYLASFILTHATAYCTLQQEAEQSDSAKALDLHVAGLGLNIGKESDCIG